MTILIKIVSNFVNIYLLNDYIEMLSSSRSDNTEISSILSDMIVITFVLRLSSSIEMRLSVIGLISNSYDYPLCMIFKMLTNVLVLSFIQDFFEN